MASLVSSCLIEELILPDRVAIGDEFELSISVVDTLADSNPWKGTLSIMVPQDWEYAGGRYDGDLGSGEMLLREAWTDQSSTGLPISKTDSLRAPDEGMKWIDLESDSAYSYDKPPVRSTAFITLKTGAEGGEFPLGFIVSKNSFPSAADVLGFWPDGSADSLFNQIMKVGEVVNTGSEDLPSGQFISEAYPNPGQSLYRIDTNLLTEAEVKVFDLAGRSINLFDGKSTFQASTNTIIIDLNQRVGGLYIVTIESGGIRISRSILHQP